MYLHFNNRRAKCLRASDSGGKAEYYWTWQVYTEEPTQTLVQQGFSIGCPIDDGYGFRPGMELELNDPKFTVQLPPASSTERRVVCDLYCWESDHSTEEVKKVFTNAAAAKLWQIFEKQKTSKSKTLEEFTRWLDESGSGFLEEAMGAIGAAGAALPALALAKKAIPLIKMAVDVARSNGDDYIGYHRTELFYVRANGKLKFRWMLNNGVETLMVGEQKPYYVQLSFMSSDSSNQVVTKSFFQVIDAIPA
jgi:hypothetical protein